MSNLKKITEYDFAHGLHRDANGFYIPIIPSDFSRPLTHEEMDYNLALQGEMIKNYAVRGNNSTDAYEMTATDVGKTLVFRKDSNDNYFWNVETVTSGGPSGPQGNQGATGAQGVLGFQGRQGPTGVQGTVGSQGNQGPTGIQGTTGQQGNQGPIGVQGSIGVQGTTGLQGTTGQQGNQGPTGVQGALGNQGATGAQGITGQQGNQGPTGLNGDDGSVWYTGTGPEPTPGATPFLIGDLYLNTVTGNISTYNVSAWIPNGNIFGPQGNQ